MYFAPLQKRFPSGYRRWGSKTRIMALPGRESSLTISSAIWIECTNVTDGRTDERTDTGRQQRQRLRIASRGKNRQQIPNGLQKPTGIGLHRKADTNLKYGHRPKTSTNICIVKSNRKKSPRSSGSTCLNFTSGLTIGCG